MVSQVFGQVRKAPELRPCLVGQRSDRFLQVMFDMMRHEEGLGFVEGADNGLKLLRRLKRLPIVLDHRDNLGEVPMGSLEPVLQVLVCVPRSDRWKVHQSVDGDI